GALVAGRRDPSNGHRLHPRTRSHAARLRRRRLVMYIVVVFLNIGFPGSARILSSPQRHEEDKDAPRSCPCESSWLRVFAVRFFGCGYAAPTTNPKILRWQERIFFAKSSRASR